ALSFSMLLASFLAVKTTHFLTIVLSVELISICSYVLTNLNRSSKASEASLKFLLFGASATALMLFGLSFIYGLTGSLNLDMLQYSESFRTQSPLLFHFAWLLFLSGIFFKLTLVPFHFWAPDAYEGTSTPVVGLFSVLPKIVGSLLLFRIVQALSLPLLEHTLLPGLLQRVLAAIALLSITWGNILAFRQKEIKRMMAYSTISQSGLIAGAAMLGTGAGLHSLLFYLAVYLLMNFGQFQLLILAENLGAETKFKDFYGKGKMHPALGVWAVILALALTGLPITAGFSGKLFVFSAIWRQFTATGSAEFAILVAGGILNTVLALFYYIKLPYVMFFKDGEKNNWLITRRLDHSLIALFCSPLILFFIKPDWLLSVIESLVPIF
ncbi:MAG: NADH-quinone oxidoreductase subunit N, partial [Cytophagales bacterium]|nr:NADH-quinone oxidoreductase subunit N [Cytophagales bacterium]